MLNEVINDLGLALVYLIPISIVWVLGMKCYDWFTPFKLQDHLVEKDNPAVSVAYGGFALGLVLAIGGIFHGYESQRPLVQDLIVTVGYGFLAVALMLVSSIINDKVILSNVSTKSELEKGNVAIGAVEAASFIANGLVLFGALSGQGSLLTGLAFWLVAQFVLLVVSIVYNMITKFDVKTQLAQGNSAVGFSVAGFMIAMGVVLKASTQGSFESWMENLTTFGIVVGFSLATMPLIRLFLDKVLLSKSDLCKELSVDQNIGIGAVEGLFYVSSALMISWVMLS